LEVREHLRICLEALTVHKLRSFLTTLGIILGVASVIAMLSIGEGAKREALAKFKQLGVNNIIVRDKKLSELELEEARAKFSKGLSREDAQAILTVVPSVEQVAPQAELEVEATIEDRTAKVTVVGVTPEMFRILNYELQSGDLISREQYDNEKRICLLGADVARDLFSSRDPLGKMVKLDDQWFEVIGVMGSRSLYTETVGELAARNLNRDVYLPLTSFLRRFSKEDVLASEIDQLTIRVGDSDRLVETGAVIRRILDRKHYGNRDFEIVIPYELLRQKEKETRIYNLVLGSIAAISLLVGGIGIMNIMLASVLERTREIGIRRALGARRREIMSQFVTEAVGLSLVGGTIGVVLGVAISIGVGNIGKFGAVVSPFHVILAFFVSALVGIASGTFPARRAANIDPIEALRYE